MQRVHATAPVVAPCLSACWALCLAMGATAPALAQEATPATSPAVTTPAANSAELVLPALTPIQIEIDSPLNSKTAQIGQMFPLHLALPIALNGKQVIPAGAKGEGEVIHAKKSGMSGSSGILILAARYLDVGGKRLRLRSFKLNGVGTSNETAAVVAAAAVGPFSLLVKGHNTDILTGARAEAKTAEDFAIPAQVVQAAQAAPAFPQAILQPANPTPTPTQTENHGS